MERRYLLSLSGQLFPGQGAGTGTSPSLTVADVNLDGAPDFVTADVGTNTLTTLLGDGKGNFTKFSSVATSTWPNSPVASDFTGDGKLDIAVTSMSANIVQLYRGTGTGSFVLQANFNVGARPSDLVSADFNNDGKIDLATANQNGASASILLSNGNGTFAVAKTVSVPASPEDMMTSDFNRDGKVDLVLTSDTALTVLLGNGNGTFTAASPLAIGTTSYGVAVADFNGDQIPDIVNGNWNNSLRVFLGNGDGNFVSAPAPSFQSTSYSVGIADLNGDGKMDLVTPYDTNNLTMAIALGNGNGTFSLSRTINYNFGDIHFVDLTGDGILDLCGVGATSCVDVLVGKGNGSFNEAMSFNISSYSVAAADFNMDGKTDILSGSLILGLGNSQWSSGVTVPIGGGLKTITADLNSDSKPDYVTTGTKLSAVLGNGDGTFMPATTILTGTEFYDVVAADFNADGKIDLALADDGVAKVYVLIGNGDGSFAAPITLIVGASPTSLGVADFNGDQKLDIAVANYRGASISRFTGNGDGTFTAMANLNVTANTVALIPGDFNHDGLMDLATANDSWIVATYLNTGNFNFSPPKTIDLKGRAISIACADFNLDGNFDIAAGLDNNGRMAILLGKGDGSFAYTGTSIGLRSARVLAVDLNDDGKPDLASTDFISHKLWVLLNQGISPPAPPKILSAGFSYEQFSVTLQFDASLDSASLSPSDLEIVNLSDGGVCSASGVEVTQNSTTAIFHLALPFADGNYEFHVAAGSIVGTTGFSTVEGASFLSFILAADANRDRVVDTQDFNLLAANFGSSAKVFSQGNFDYDAGGNVDSVDFGILVGQYGKRLPAPLGVAGAAPTIDFPVAALFAAMSSQSSDEDLFEF